MRVFLSVRGPCMHLYMQIQIHVHRCREYGKATDVVVHLNETTTMVQVRLYLEFASVVPRVLDDTVVIPVAYVCRVMFGHQLGRHPNPWFGCLYANTLYWGGFKHCDKHMQKQPRGWKINGTPN
jgi:hypothetical protein